MWSKSVHKLMKTQAVFKPVQASLFMLPQRNFCYRWAHKNRDIFYPSSWNTPDKRSSSNLKMGKIKYRTQDPLFLDPKLYGIEGGIKPYLVRIHDERAYDIPLRNIAFVLYHSAKEGLFDNLLYKQFEQNYHRLISTKIQPREAFAGVWACYTTGIASADGLAFWENKLEDLNHGLHIKEMTDLLLTFNKRKHYKAQHIINILDKYMKDRILKVWDEQILYNQRMMYILIQEFDKLNYRNEDIDMKLIKTINTKQKIQNIYFFEEFHNFFHNINENPKSPHYGKLGEEIKTFETKFYNKDFQWRYNLEERRIRTHKEVVARRDEPQWEDFFVVQMKDERSEREKRRMEAAQQLKNAVYNEELFIKVVKQMMDEGKTLIEMMVYLDVDESALTNAFTIISKNEQVKKLEEIRKQNKLPFEKPGVTDSAKVNVKGDEKLVPKPEAKV